jgi:hypothetical protein
VGIAHRSWAWAREQCDPGARVARLYRLLYRRAPDPYELAMAREFLADRSGGLDARPAPAQVLLMADEFVFVD